jgi:hypothetical protein
MPTNAQYSSVSALTQKSSADFPSPFRDVCQGEMLPRPHICQIAQNQNENGIDFQLKRMLTFANNCGTVIY